MKIRKQINKFVRQNDMFKKDMNFPIIKKETKGTKFGFVLTIIYQINIWVFILT